MNQQQTTNNQQPIPLSIPSIQGNEWKYIKDCLDTNWVSSVGSYVNRFEKDLAGYIGVEHAVAMTSGTGAIHIALLVAGVLPGDEVIVPSLTFVSPVNCIRYAGAHPVFMDVDPDYWQIDVTKLTDFIETKCICSNGALHNKTTERRITAVIPVDILGHSVDLDPIIELGQKYNFKVIEDATESLGAEYKEQKVGSSPDIACFSFNGNKIMTTGGGGMFVTNNTKFAEKARYLSQQAKDDPLEYIHNEIGYNYRMTNIQAAMGCAQLENIDSYVKKKLQIAARYDQAFKDIPGIRCPEEAEWAKSTFWLYTILVDKSKYGMDSRELLQKLNSLKIQTRPLWKPIYQLPPFCEDETYQLEIVDKLYRDGLSIPSSVDLTDEEQHHIIEAIQSL